MPRTRIPLSVEMDNGATLQLVADQRDIAALEAAEITSTLTRVRHLAYTTAKRAGLYDGPWDEWNTRDCVEAISADDDEAEPDDGGGDSLDPGRPGASASG